MSDVAEARAQSRRIAARLALSRQTLQRWEGLLQRHSPISQQEIDEKRSMVLGRDLGREVEVLDGIKSARSTGGGQYGQHARMAAGRVRQ